MGGSSAWAAAMDHAEVTGDNAVAEGGTLSVENAGAALFDASAYDTRLGLQMPCIREGAPPSVGNGRPPHDNAPNGIADSFDTSAGPSSASGMPAVPDVDEYDAEEWRIFDEENSFTYDPDEFRAEVDNDSGNDIQHPVVIQAPTRSALGVGPVPRLPQNSAWASSVHADQQRQQRFYSQNGYGAARAGVQGSTWGSAVHRRQAG